MRFSKATRFFFLLIGFICVAAQYGSLQAATIRIKDAATVRGNRSNYLVGMGLVVGLNATGDSPKSILKNQATAALFTKLGNPSKPEEINAASTAAVAVTAELPTYMRSGSRLDVKIAALGDAKSLAGGTLLLTQLRAADGNTYAVAQGAVAIAQASGAGVSVLTNTYLPQAAIVEREFTPNIVSENRITLSLIKPDYTTATRLSEKINTHLKGFFATALDAAGISVEVPPSFTESIPEFITEIESLTFDTDERATVVINERTGTVVLGGDVRIDRIALNHGAISIQVEGKSEEKGKENQNKKTVMDLDGSSVSEFVKSLNSMGVRPAELISIIQAIHAAGALHADLKFM